MANNTAKSLAKAFEGFGLGHAISMKVPGVSEYEGALAVRCGDGYLVARPVGDPGNFSEIEIDLVADDGRLLQLAVVGRDEYEDDYQPDYDYRPMHVYAWDGMHELVASSQYVTVSDDSYWYEKED